jgi:hypothetical protein
VLEVWVIPGLLVMGILTNYEQSIKYPGSFCDIVDMREKSFKLKKRRVFARSDGI